MSNPNTSDKCGSCQHIFGKHYVTFNNAEMGCTNSDATYHGSYSCSCKGFMIKYVPSSRTSFSDSSSAYRQHDDGWGGPGQPYGT